MKLQISHLVLLGVAVYFLIFLSVRYPIRLRICDTADDTWRSADIVNLAMLFVTLALAIQGQLGNQRAEKLFAAESKPLVHAVPAFISQLPNTQTMLLLKVTNYSGFVAKNVRFDVRFGDRFWTSQWQRARGDKKAKGSAAGVEVGLFYDVDPAYASNIAPELLPRGGNGILRTTNAMSLEGEVCITGDKGYPVQIRLVWENEHGHTSESLTKYRLVCTKDTESDVVGDGRSFTFLPE